MLTWILTSGAIAAFSAAALELFREDNLLNSGRAAKLRAGQTWLESGPVFAWEQMTDADLDALMAAFLTEAAQGEGLRAAA